MTNKIVEKRHETYTTPEDVVFEIVKNATGNNPVKREKIVKGYDNEVYSIETEQGNNFIVRIRRFGEVEFRQEAWAIEQSKNAGVPVPQVFFVGNIPTKDGANLEVMVLEKLDGDSLANIRQTIDDANLRKILVEAGKILAKIHSVKSGGFYQRHENGEWDFSDWEREMDSSIKDRSGEKELILSAGFSPSDFDFMIEMMKKYKTEFPCTQPVLNHGDYLPEHIFVGKDLRISGIIDFGMFQGAPPIHDLAYLSFEEPKLDISAIKEGYSNKALFDDNFEMRLNLHKLGLQMGHLAHNIRIGDNTQAQTISGELRKTLQFLKG